MVIEKNDRLILLTNDDGLYAAGLKTLLEVMEEFGKIVLGLNNGEPVRHVAGSYGEDSPACQASRRK